jgi:hypothetical protein
LLRFKEKGGKEKELPVHHKLEEILDQYLKASGLEKEPQSPLFPAALGKSGKLSRRPLARTDAADMLNAFPNFTDGYKAFVRGQRSGIRCGDATPTELLQAGELVEFPQMAFWKFLTFAGLFFNLVGVVLLFRYALPKRQRPMAFSSLGQMLINRIKN